MSRWCRALAVVAIAVTATMAEAAPPEMAATTDPWIWLEEVESERALDWVRAQNARTLPKLEATSGFADHQARILQILEDPRRVAWPSGAGPEAVTRDHLFNFWRDGDHVRGLWRRTSRQAHDAGQPEWQTLLDMDALEAAEGRNFQFGGADCLTPDQDRCLLRLSVGGKDAVELREFDLKARRFIPASEGGFFAAEAKQFTAWLDRDHLLLASASHGATDSGYARDVRLWQRGTSSDQAQTLLRIDQSDMALYPAVYGHGASRRAVLIQALTFWTARIHHLRPDGSLIPLPLPEDADFRFIADIGSGPRAYALLRSDHGDLKRGTLVSLAIPDHGTPGQLEAVFTPGSSQAIQSVRASDQALYVHLLDDVAARLIRLQHDGQSWQTQAMPLADNSTLTLLAATPDDRLYASIENFTEPARLVRFDGAGESATLASAPAFFDAETVHVQQYFASSRDGTKIPYFVVRPHAAKGPLRTLLWAYGGFEIALTPSYLQPDQQLWIEGGNQFVVANIRGGGEFGAAWHQAALKDKRQTSYDDLHAVAEDLQRRELASAIAVHGRSNGGLMASVAYTQRPDLYAAAMVGVPLADMKRYHLLLAGASWMAEYGNPDTADWDFIRRYSPYQNIRRDAQYPRVFFYTSTKDDRVHPGHARKMAARMQQLGHAIYYYENTDGGHAGVADLRESAYRQALMLAYLDQELK